MKLTIDVPSEIYQKINDALTIIIESMTGESNDLVLNKAENEARERLGQLQKYLQKQLSDLKKNAEWDTFTIAFYGETGAGKSILIETLRIILQEPTKLEEQKKYRQLKCTYESSVDSIQSINNKIEIINKNFVLEEKKFSSISETHKENHRKLMQLIEEHATELENSLQPLIESLQQKEQINLALMKTIEALEVQIAEHKQKAKLWQRIVLLFKKLPEEQMLKERKGLLFQEQASYMDTQQILNDLKAKAAEKSQPLFDRQSELNEKYEQDQQNLVTEQQQVEAEKQVLAQKLVSLNAQLETQENELTKCADGKIIGDGRTDFTQRTHRYDFNFKGNHFALLDVPGIEGKEELVLGEVENAVQTAHAVFYVTNKAAPPQTGDENQKGTLEKIKDHLGFQTEVWSIFNKKVTNPKHTLKNRSLISEDEQASLTELDERVQEQLGQNYKGTFPLTAFPAFLASTDYFPPNSQNAKRRTKFLQDFTESELLERSRMQVFLDMLTNRLLPESEKKIKQANFNKARDTINKTTENLSNVEQTYVKLADSIFSTSESSKDQLNSSFEIMKTLIKREGKTLIHKFIQNVRNEVYNSIKEDISNNDFKNALSTSITNGLEEVSHGMPLVIHKEIAKFQKDVEDILQRFEEHAQDFTSASEEFSKTKLDMPFNIKINIDSGINKIALLGALVGVALIPFTGGASGWVAAGAILTALIGVWKALASAFHTSYKMSQQRKSTNENLSKIENVLKNKFDENFKEALPEMENTIKGLRQALEAPIVKMQETAKLLRNSNQKLESLSGEIQALGGL